RSTRSALSPYTTRFRSVDEVVGVLLARDLWRAIRAGEGLVATVMREPLFVPQTRAVEPLIADMRRQRIKMAIVIDEYGGTAGLRSEEHTCELQSREKLV